MIRPASKDACKIKNCEVCCLRGNCSIGTPEILLKEAHKMLSDAREKYNKEK